LFWLLHLGFLLITLVVTAIGFQHAFGVSGLWTIPVVVVISFLPFGRIMKLVLLIVGVYYLYTHGVDFGQIEKMFRPAS
jgi:hypothetical protein